MSQTAEQISVFILVVKTSLHNYLGFDVSEKVKKVKKVQLSYLAICARKLRRIFFP